MELGEYEASTRFSAEEKLVLRLADAMAATPAAIDDELFTQLTAAFSQEQVVELASALAWENYRARFNRVFDVESEDFSGGAFMRDP